MRLVTSLAFIVVFGVACGGAPNSATGNGDGGSQAGNFDGGSGGNPSPGSDGGSRKTAVDGGPGASTPEGGSADGGPGASSPDGGLVDSSGPMNVGSLTLVNAGTGASLVTEITGEFLQGFTITLPDSGVLDAGTCKMQTIDACKIETCPPTEGGNGNGTFVSAGDITISGGTGPIALTPGYDDEYGYSSAVSGATAPGGSVLHVVAAGAVVPAFSATITMPDELTVTSPEALAGANSGGASPLTIVRSSGLSIAWTGGSGNVQVVIYQLLVTGFAEATCIFPASGGTATVDTAVLDLFATTDSGTALVTTVGVSPAFGTATVTPPGWIVTVQGEASSASSFTSTATLE